MSEPTFGWITQLAAKDGARPERLLKDNLAYIEALRPPFTTLWFEDHLQWDGTAVLESWSTLATMAARFPGLRCGTLVLCQSYRNPALLAKMTASLQVLSGGRLIAGIGAGWKQDEYLAYGYPFPPDGERLEQLEETAIILRKMWSESPVTYKGSHYQVEAAYCEPKPEPAPPLLIGGGGERVTLRVVAQHADWMNLLFASPATFKHKDGVLRRHCEELGRDPDTITRSLYGYVLVTPEGRKPAPRSGDKYIIHGKPEQVAEQISAFLDLGVEHFMLRFLDFPSTDGLALFQEEVVSML
jgi:alkanesulfonate monooxygenase SsuD/methylene tetrahydromethanopterin reductase-like flavin-dependent oxidoreductase (luciferase family)